MDPDLLNNLYLMGGLLAAVFVIMWRLNSASQKAILYSVEKVEYRLEKVEDRLTTVEGGVSNLQTEMAVVKDRLGKVEEGLVVVDDRVRNLQMDMAVVKDRLHILTDAGPASPAAVRAGLSVPQAAAAEA